MATIKIDGSNFGYDELDSILNNNSNFISNDYDFDSTSTLTKKVNQILTINSTKQNK